MSRKFCGCCSNDKLQQGDFRGNGCFGDFSKPYGSDQASKHVLGRADVTLTSVPQNSHQHTAQRQHNTKIRQPQMSRKFCGCCSKDKLQEDDFTGNGCFGDFLNSNKTFVTLVVVWSRQNRCHPHVGAWEFTPTQYMEETIRTCLVEK